MTNARVSFVRALCMAAVVPAASTAMPPGAGAGPRVTLDGLLAAPHASSLAAAPSGGAVAFVLDERGVRNVWVAQAPGYVARRLTSWEHDDGMALHDLAFTPDGAAVVFVRGDGPNRDGERPNPRSLPDAIEQEVLLLPLAGGDLRRFGAGSAPEVSPRGERVAFLREGKVFAAPLDGSQAAAELFRARGRVGGLRWSPDGRRLAFVSRRARHSFVGVFELESRRIVYLDPSLDSDASPAWSPDGTRVAFVRVPAAAPRYPFYPEREGRAWSLRVADAATGAGREVWRAEPGRGSVFNGLAGRDDLLWAGGDVLVFPWEAGGWRRLYGVGVAGGAARLLTPGEGEVEQAALTDDARGVLYASNQGDIDRRHAWRVPVAGGAPQALTSGEGIEWSPLSAGSGVVALLRSDARRPARAALIEGGRLRDLGPPLPAGFPADALAVPQRVEITAADGMRIPAQLFLPPGAEAGRRRPAVVFFHGGSRRQMLLGWHDRAYYHQTYAFNQYLAARGYLVLSVNYRSGTGYGLEFREALDYGAAGASEFRDVTGAALYLRGRPDVDPARIALWGGSYGGYLTALGLARASDLFVAGVDVHGVHDWNVVIKNFAPDWNPQAQAERARVAFESSPMAALATWRSPVLLVHGDDDRNVPFSESVDLAAALAERGVPFEQLVLPDEVHSFLLHASWRRVFSAAAAFLERHLEPPAR